MQPATQGLGLAVLPQRRSISGIHLCRRARCNSSARVSKGQDVDVTFEMGEHKMRVMTVDLCGIPLTRSLSGLARGRIALSLALASQKGLSS